MADRDLSKYRIMASYVLLCNRKVIIVENANLNPTEIANFLKFAKMYNNARLTTFTVYHCIYQTYLLYPVDTYPPSR